MCISRSSNSHRIRFVRAMCSIVRYNNSDTIAGRDVRMCRATLWDTARQNRNQMTDCSRRTTPAVTLSDLIHTAALVRCRGPLYERRTVSTVFGIHRSRRSRETVRLDHRAKSHGVNEIAPHGPRVLQRGIRQSLFMERRPKQQCVLTQFALRSK